MSLELSGHRAWALKDVEQLNRKLPGAVRPAAWGAHLGQVDDSGDLLPFHSEGLQDPGAGQDLPSDHLSAGSRHGCVIYGLNCHDRQVPLGERVM